MNFTRKEVAKVFKKFYFGNYITSEKELAILERYANTGMTSYSKFNFKEGLAEGRVTKQGKWWIKGFRDFNFSDLLEIYFKRLLHIFKIRNMFTSVSAVK